MSENALNNDRNTDPTVLAFLIAATVWLAGQITHSPEATQEFSQIVLPFVPHLLERR